MVGPVNAKISVVLPALYRFRLALACTLIGWAAALIAGVFNGVRVEVE
jgi:hypothetical protein